MKVNLKQSKWNNTNRVSGDNNNINNIIRSNNRCSIRREWIV